MSPDSPDLDAPDEPEVHEADGVLRVEYLPQRIPYFFFRPGPRGLHLRLACLGAVQFLVAALQVLDVLLVHRAALLPAPEHVVPGDLTSLEVPPLLLGHEVRREGVL